MRIAYVSLLQSSARARSAAIAPHASHFAKAAVGCPGSAP